MNARYTSPFSYYRDPREDERAIGALVGVGRPPAGPSDEQRAIALQGLVRAAQPAEDPGPDPRAELIAAERAKAAGALVAAQPEPETAPVQQPDPAEVEAAQSRLGASALARRFQEQQEAETAAAAAPVTAAADPEAEARAVTTRLGASALAQRHQQQAEAERIAAESQAASEPAETELTRQGTASSTAALAQVGKAAAAKRAALEAAGNIKAPVPVTMRDRVSGPDMEISMAESDRALGTTPTPDPVELNPYYGSTRTAARKPDMDLSNRQEAWALTSKPNPQADREMVAELDAMQAGHEGRDPLPGMKLSSDPNPPRATPKMEFGLDEVEAYNTRTSPKSVSSAEGEGAALKQPSKPNPELEAAVASERVEDGGSSRPDPVEQAIKTAGDNATTPSADADPKTSADAPGSTNKLTPTTAEVKTQQASAPRERTVDDDPGPQLNGWMLAADLLNNGGKNMSSIIAQHEQAKAAWKTRRDGLSEREYQHGRDAKGDEFRERQFSAQEAERKADREHTNRTSDMSEWHLTDASQRDWEAKENERKRSESLDADRKTDNARAAAQLAVSQGQLAETRRYHEDSIEGRKTHDREIAEGKQKAAEDVFGDKYSRTNKRTLGAATAIQKIRGVMSRYEDKDGNVKEGGVPGFGEVESVIGARGPWTRAIAGIGNSDEYNADAETILAAGRNAVNLVLRDESGAAAPVPEHVETVIRAGFEPGASEAQARESLKQMEELVYSRLNADAVSHPERARAILEAQGLDPKRIRAVVASQKTATDEGGTTPPPPAPSTAGNDEGERALTPEEAAETYHVKATMPDGTKVDKVLTLAEVDDLRKNRARIHSSIESSLETTGPDAGDTQSFTPKPVRGTPAPLGRSPTKEELQGLVDELGVRKKVKR